MLEGQDLFLCLYLIYSYNEFIHEPHSCKNTSVCYKKTILNIDWHDILPFIYIDEQFSKHLDWNNIFTAIFTNGSIGKGIGDTRKGIKKNDIYVMKLLV